MGPNFGDENVSVRSCDSNDNVEKSNGRDGVFHPSRFSVDNQVRPMDERLTAPSKEEPPMESMRHTEIVSLEDVFFVAPAKEITEEADGPYRNKVLGWAP